MISFQSRSLHLASSRFGISLTQIVGFAVLSALSSKIQVPLDFTPVPVTLQTFVVLLSGALLGPYKAAASQLTLIGMGLAGLPVFTSPLPGHLVLLGPTGGYIMGFVLAAFVSGWIFQNTKKRCLILDFVYMFIASFFILVPGLIYLGRFTGMDWHKTLALGFWPFILGDLIKCFLAAVFLQGKSVLLKTKD